MHFYYFLHKRKITYSSSCRRTLALFCVGMLCYRILFFWKSHVVFKISLISCGTINTCTNLIQCTQSIFSRVLHPRRMYIVLHTKCRPNAVSANGVVIAVPIRASAISAPQQAPGEGARIFICFRVPPPPWKGGAVQLVFFKVTHW